MSAPPDLKRAKFTPKPGQGNALDVHFNPVSLQYSVTNTLSSQGQDKTQYVDKTTAKLTMDLVFDTTDTGQDVRIYTKQIVQYMNPVGQGKKKIPAVVTFEWGSFKFEGMVESYKETIDFFAASGVPLRATVNLTLADQKFVFEKNLGAAPKQEPVEVPTTTGNNGAKKNATDLASGAGDPDASRAVAASNNQESMRFPDGPSLTIDPSIHLGGPVAFAAGGAGIAGGIGLGGGIAAGAGIGIGGGIAAGGGIGVGGGFAAGGGVALGGGLAAGGAAGIGGGFTAGGGVVGGGGFAAGGGVVGGVVAGGGFAGSAGVAGGFVGGGAVGIGAGAVGGVGFGAAGGAVVAGGGFVGGGVVAGGAAVGGISSFSSGGRLVTGGGGFVATESFSAGAGFGGASVGGSWSAGVSASSGAFSWVHTSSASFRTSTSLDPGLLVRGNMAVGVAVDDGAIFGVGGQAVVHESASLSADVGARPSLQMRIRFDGG